MKKFRKLLHLKKKVAGQELSGTATPSGESTPPSERTPSTSRGPVTSNQTIVSPSDPTITPSGVAAHPDEPIMPAPEVSALSNESTALPSQTTAPGAETVVTPSRERDFWKEAVQMLAEEYKLPEEWQTGTIDRENVVDMVKAKMEECKDRQWKVEIGGTEVVVREVLGKTLDWVQKFALVGDAAVQFDPGSAALPWAGFRFLLQLAVNEKETHGAMMAGLERATWLTFYCSAQERLYKDYFADNDKYSILNDAFVKDLVHLYAATLKFLIQAFNYYDENAALRMVKSALTPSTWVKELMKAIDERKRGMQDYASLVHKSNVHQALKDALGMLEPFSKYMSEEAARRKEKKRGEFMRWLSDVDYRGNHEANSRNILENSGDWMLRDEEKFDEWKDRGTILWLRGIPGAGKTKLTSTIIDHLMKSDENHTVAYFYCIRDAQYSKNADPEEILRAILKQLVILLPSQCSDHVRKKHEEEKKGGEDHGSIRRLTFEECADLILELITDRPVTIVIDALDECRETALRSSQGSDKDRQDLLNQLQEMIDAKPGKFKVFLSSREDEDIWGRLRDYPNITINASKNGDDILRFIKVEVDKLITKRSYLRDDESLKEEIVKAVDNRADGMFRSPALQIDYLYSLKTRESVKKRLGELPATLHDLHDEIYRRISVMEEEASVISKGTLSWLLCARRQLSSSELLTAVSSDPEQRLSIDELLRLCRHLIVLNEVSDSFELAHLSVREYLENHEEYKDGQPHGVVAELCIKRFELEVARGTLDQYASLYWMDHYSSRPHTGEDILTDMVKNFFRDKGANPAFEEWAEIAKDSSKSLPWGNNLWHRLRDARYKPLSVVCVFGFLKLLDQWMDNTPGYSYFRDSEDMVVHLAIKWGNAEVVRVLLQNDTQPTTDKFGWTSSFWAAIYKQLLVLEVLKELPGHVDATDDVGWTALHWMVLLGQVEGLKHLLSVEARSIMVEKAMWTPLHWAVFLDRETETEALVGKHRLDSEDCDGLTAFQWAKFVGNGETAKYLWTSEAGDSFSSNLRLSAGRKSVRMD